MSSWDHRSSHPGHEWGGGIQGFVLLIYSSCMFFWCLMEYNLKMNKCLNVHFWSLCLSVCFAELLYKSPVSPCPCGGISVWLSSSIWSVHFKQIEFKVRDHWMFHLQRILEECATSQPADEKKTSHLAKPLSFNRERKLPLFFKCNFLRQPK